MKKINEIKQDEKKEQIIHKQDEKKEQIIHKQDEKKEQIIHNTNNKPYIWLYWENKDKVLTPAYIELCYKTVLTNCNDSFEIIRLNQNIIYNYLPELIEYKTDIEKLIIAQKVDIYRIMLLYKYGGLYIDSDTIVLKNPIEIIKKLEKYDYVGFGCTGNTCTYGYKQPSNGIMASKKKSELMGKVLKKLLIKIKEKDKFDYFDLGKYVIWDTINEIDDYEYYHYPNKYDGTRDKYGLWVINEFIFSDRLIEYEDEQNMIFFTMYNSQITDQFKNMTEKELLSKNWNFTKFLKRGLKIN
jgi:hypothetical protein